MKKTILGLSAAGLALAIASPGAPVARAVQGSSLDIPHTFQSGTPALASEVNDNFGAVRTHALGLSDAIDDAVLMIDDVGLALDDLAARFASSENLLTVAPEGGDFSSLADALAAAGDAAALLGERVVVLVLPGTYDASATLDVPSDVTLLGTSRTATLLRVQASPAVELADGAQIVSLGVQNTLDDETVIGIRAVDTGSETLIEDVRVLASDPAPFITGIVVVDGELTLRRSEVLVDDVGSIGLQVSGSNATPARVVVEDTEIRANAFGLDAFLECEVSVLRSVVGALTPLFVHFEGAVVSVEASVLEADTDTSTVINAFSDAEVFVGTSQVAGGDPVVNTGANVRFVHCFKRNFTAIVNGNNSSTE